MNIIKILLAEDEISLGKIVSESLVMNGFEVVLCTDGEQAFLKYQETPNDYDILILDVMMPKKDGFTLAKKIRRSNTSIPILFLTAKSQTKDVIAGFEAGGNDYLKKPFSMEELIVRIKSLVNRTQTIQKHTSHTVTIGQYRFNSKKQKLYYKQSEIALTSRESDLLHQLYLYKNAVLERQYILEKLWGTNDFFTARSMDVFISKLRKKLKYDSKIAIINVRGYGYKLVC